jgi:hypothetical protein
VGGVKSDDWGGRTTWKLHDWQEEQQKWLSFFF